ncbi:hypothetical protein M438DRAFT_346369 [Aureobasidium pullulans EXF-150]|uniref:F-box domain-containing protein n=1 Tax=Aureobasidium pullulans EXF-150 TaxID=1043002 RepID=A0A074XI86_AURPU|nr:uncharacterized protein M438DRAFT_346369 [Aureobasidium pullulans EXF-150]KEQ83414.1 hypothetical protein M438DRAFT_346369 [Aureobasidium pullulans EXF-150]
MASLLSLPPEIFEAVLEDVDGDDVLNLRRVNRRISALSTHQFGLKCLADLSFLCHQVSLKGLLELVAHPLGRYIKRLTFSTHVDWPFQGPLVDKIERERPRVLDTWDFGKSSSPLTQALRTLDGLGIRPILGIYDPLVPWIALDDTRSGRERKGYGFDKFYGDMQVKPTMRTWALMTVRAVLDAVEQAGFPLREFHAHLDSHRRSEDGLDTDLFDFLKYRFITPAFREPDLDLEVVYNSFNRQANLNFQINIDTKSQKYEYLTLPNPERDWLRHPRMSLVQREGLVPSISNMPHKFHQLRLALVDTSFRFLTELLGSQADTLRILHLEYVTINLFDEEEDDDNLWAADPDATGLNVLLFLRDELDLDYLRMNRVSNSRDQSRLIGGHDDTWTTTEEIQDGLQMYIQREENDEHSVDEEFSDDDEAEWISVHHSEDEDEEPEEFHGPRGSQRS